ncbi:large-conductance mechanosensitive channel protein MscL [Pseudomonas sp. RIT-PI-S]|uniref:large-conductance mechanosensitive channel protein MscL n=1 Tax=Pseudomonas sp. RIT-PI-S TaxID=3035295 RepID=UPI0021D873E8|nr:large-conductance mechanosensitive channel protein MscL [Pseudomonas sp. RIT-PI-S]
MSLIKEFKAFAVKGNVVDMAVGIIIGAAFGKIVSSFVGDVIMPPLGLLIGGVDFTNLAVVLKPAEGDVPAVVLAYGKFIQTVVDFLIVAFAIFIGVKMINRLKHEEAKAPSVPPVPSKEELLLGEIRDLLKEQNGQATPATVVERPPIG